MTNFYAILAPLVIGCIIVEFVYCLYKKNGFYEFQDSVSSLGTMVVTQVINVFYAYCAYHAYLYLHNNFAVYQIQEMNLWLYLLCFIGVDFFFYWYHRFGHTLNILWAFHMPHHSTEELNYAVGLRASWTTRLITFLYYWPLTLVGFHPSVIIEVVAINLVLQLLPHTRVIPKLGFLETFLNTPSHHRVHHGLNQQYLDKNYAGFFIIWDKLFGTFEEEKEEVFYGVTKQPKTWDPTYVNFQWITYLWDDCKKAPYWWDKIRLWFMPLGWRPRGLEVKPRVKWTKDTLVKYRSTPLKGSYPYIMFHLVMALSLMGLTIYDQSPFTSIEKVIMGLILWAMATSWSALMESKTWALKFEMARLVMTSLTLTVLFQKYNLGLSTQWILLIHSLCILYVLFIRGQNNQKLASA
jgi:sterol desaturase/sphingolipid hydroxylase (fatty acid hydroxylase superfamily)